MERSEYSTFFSNNIAYCVTNDDKVYGFGENICEYLGYNESNDNKSYVVIQELCHLRSVLNQICWITSINFKLFISSQFFRELTKAVNYLHWLKWPQIHRDLKPENVLISNETNGVFLKLCDFGLSKSNQTSDDSQNIGTQSYMAPEVRLGQFYNTKSDVYSLALIATEIYNFEDQSIHQM